jgi:hypothetical protein
MMTSEEALEVVEQILPPGTLTSVKVVVFQVVSRDCKLKCVKGQKLRSNELLNQR